MTPDDSSPPLTRRQRRERERARAAAAARASDLPTPDAVSARRTAASELPAITGAQRALGATLGRPRPRGHTAVVLMCLALIAIVAVPLILTWASGKSAPTSHPSPTAVPATPLSADAPIATLLDVAGRLGTTPVLTLHGRITPPSSVRTEVLTAGQGHRLAEGDGIVLSVSTFSGTDGSSTTGTASGHRLYHGPLDAEHLGADLATAVTGTLEGSRLVVLAAYDEAGEPSTEITVVDVLPTIAQGEVMEHGNAQLPQVTVAEDDTVSVDLSARSAPTHGQVAMLITGQGEQVRTRDTLIARYMVLSWADGSVISSSYGWTTPPAVIDMTQTLSGLAQRLVDVPVGSRVLVSLPADQAKGEAAIVVVVDILAIADSESDTTSENGVPVPVTPASSDAHTDQVTPTPRPSHSAP